MPATNTSYSEEKGSDVGPVSPRSRKMLAEARKIDALLRSDAGAATSSSTGGVVPFGTKMLGKKKLKTLLPGDVYARFEAATISGGDTTEADQDVITTAVSKWAVAQGCCYFAHWFFPVRGGGGMLGGHGGVKHNVMLFDEEKASGGKLPGFALWQGETDGSSFPNGGLRATHTAAAYTAWDRSSALLAIGKTLVIPCAFLAWTGNPLDDKTPLLRAEDAINREGMRMLKAVGFKGLDKVKQVRPYLGWEQEFFVVSAELYNKRPDLVACGRTVFGAPPSRAQQADLNYFARIPSTVAAFLDEVTTEMLAAGCPVQCFHNEVAPGQHEISPIFDVTSQSCDFNELFMELAADVAKRHGLVILFHEKPFAGINGTGKHNNWSVGTDSGVNFFKPGKKADTEQQELFMCATAALMYAINTHNTVFRAATASAGQDHRLGAQEAPPAIVSLYPGKAMEAKIKDIISGGALAGYTGEQRNMSSGAAATSYLEAAVEDRNRTAPFPFCGNRWEYRAVGGAQNCQFPMAFVNTAYADGLGALAKLIEGGMGRRDAVAKIMKDSLRCVFTGNGYSAEWVTEAEKRGLPNLNNTVKAVKALTSDSNKSLFERMKVLSPEAVEARAEIMFESYATCMGIEAETMVRMVNTGILPALARDLAGYKDCIVPELVGERATVYKAVALESRALASLLEKVPHGGPAAECEYFIGPVKTQMGKLRGFVDTAERLCKADLWPYPSYSDLVYSHHT